MLPHAVQRIDVAGRVWGFYAPTVEGARLVMVIEDEVYKANTLDQLSVWGMALCLLALPLSFLIFDFLTPDGGDPLHAWSIWLRSRLIEPWFVGGILFIALLTIIRHRRVMLTFFAHLGNHAGAGLIAAALLILYVFNRVIRGATFWQASLGDAFSPVIPRICKSYLELLACYLIFIGALGLSITLARRSETP